MPGTSRLSFIIGLMLAFAESAVMFAVETDDHDRLLGLVSFDTIRDVLAPPTDRGAL